MIPLIDLKDHLRITHSTEDAYLVALEQAAVEQIQNVTHRYFGPPAIVTNAVYDGHGADVVWLSETPNPASGETIVVESWDGADWVVTPEADYTIDGFALYHGASVWPTGRRNIRISYQRGYAPGSEPGAIRQAVLLLVAHWYQNREPVALGTIAQELPQSVAALIGPYRRLRV